MPIGSDSKNFTILLATTSPMLSMLMSSLKLARRKISNLLKCLAKAAAVDSPTSGMPNELIKTSKVGLVAASMLANRLSIDFSPKPSRLLSLDCDYIGRVDSCGMDDGGDFGDGFTIAVMQEIGINLMDHEPKSFTDLADSSFDLVICFSEASYEAASRMPTLAHAVIEYWPVYDMELIAEGREARLNAYRNVRDDIKTMLNDRFQGLNA